MDIPHKQQHSFGICFLVLGILVESILLFYVKERKEVTSWSNERANDRASCGLRWRWQNQGWVETDKCVWRVSLQSAQERQGTHSAGRSRLVTSLTQGFDVSASTLHM